MSTVHPNTLRLTFVQIWNTHKNEVIDNLHNYANHFNVVDNHCRKSDVLPVWCWMNEVRIIQVFGWMRFWYAKGLFLHEHYVNSNFLYSLSQTNTYQAVIISDGAETFTVFTYNCDMLGWIGEVGAFASIGFSVLGDVESFRNFENYGLSQLPQVGMVACTNAEFNRPWTNLIYRIGTVTNREQIERSVCLNRLTADQEKFDFLPALALDPFFRSFGLGLVDCPCSYFQAIRDFRFFFGGFLGDNICLYTTFPVFFGGGFLAHRCCYNQFK